MEGPEAKKKKKNCENKEDLRRRIRRKRSAMGWGCSSSDHTRFVSLGVLFLSSAPQTAHFRLLF